MVSFESRRAAEAAELIRRYGGEPVSAPAMREIPLEQTEDHRRFLGLLEDGAVNVVVFLTGVGTSLLAEALAPSCPPSRLAQLLGRALVVARGPKPTAALRRLGRPPDLVVPEPNTWRELLQVLDAHISLGGRLVAVQEYGEPNRELLEALEKRGAAVVRVPVYRWALPDDQGPLRAAIRALAGGAPAVALFTSATQVRHAFQVADQLGLAAALRRALCEKVAVASIGPVCSAALREFGVEPDIEPEHPRLGRLVAEVAERAAGVLARKRGRPQTPS